jgi:hypothetical protein
MLQELGTIEEAVENGLHPRRRRDRAGPAGEHRRCDFKSIGGVTCLRLDGTGGPGLLSDMALIEVTATRKNAFK